MSYNLNFLSLVHYSTSTQCYFKVILSCHSYNLVSHVHNSFCEGPRTLHTKPRNCKTCSYLPFMLFFFSKRQGYFNSFLYEQPFFTDFFGENLCSFVCMGLDSQNVISHHSFKASELLVSLMMSSVL